MCRRTWCCQCEWSIPVFEINTPQTSSSVKSRVRRSCSLCFSPLCDFSGASHCAWTLLEILLKNALTQLLSLQQLFAQLCYPWKVQPPVWLHLVSGFRCYYRGLIGNIIAQVSALGETRINIPQREQKEEKKTQFKKPPSIHWLKAELSPAFPGNTPPLKVEKHPCIAVSIITQVWTYRSCMKRYVICVSANSQLYNYS